MQSKLPVRIKRKQVYGDKKKCCCAQLLKIMIDKPMDTTDRIPIQKGLSEEDFPTLPQKKFHTRSTQTEIYESHMGYEKRSYTEIKCILISINKILENILHTLQDKKEYLYNKLQHEASTPYKMSKTVYNKNKVEKVKKKNTPLGKKFTYTWPEISRLYYGQPPWMKHYMQKFAYNLPPTNSSLVICPKRQSWSCSSRPFSCSDIKYFQTRGKILERKSYGVSIYPNTIFTVIDGYGDDLQPNLVVNEDIDDTDNRKCIKKLHAREFERVN